MATVGAAQHPQEKFGPFELVERIGLGGMATVHRALQRGAGGFAREVVVKRILPQLADDRQFVQMFIEEAKLGAHLNHPNIVQIYDLGQIDASYFMSMEYVEGVSLLEVMRYYSVREPVDAALAAHVIMQVCVGLDYAHNLELGGRPLGLVHRDVSPANVMISRHGSVKLLDFGIAKAKGAIEREETRAGTLKGKLSYMSPEQVEGAPVTARSDIFVTGILLWELLAGRRLFRAVNDYDTLRNVVQADVPPLTPLRPDAPLELIAICQQALSRDPAKRFASAEEMGDALEQRVLATRSVAQTDLCKFIDPVVKSPKTQQARTSDVTSAPRPQAVRSAPLAVRPMPRPAVKRAPTRTVSAPPMRDRWVLTLVAFVGGAIAAMAIVVAALLLTGAISLPRSGATGKAVDNAPTNRNASHVVVGYRDGQTRQWEDSGARSKASLP